MKEYNIVAVYEGSDTEEVFTVWAESEEEAYRQLNETGYKIVGSM